MLVCWDSESESISQCGPFEGDGATLRSRRGMAPHWELSTYSQHSWPQSGSRTRRADVLTRFCWFPSFVCWVSFVSLVGFLLSLWSLGLSRRERYGYMSVV